MGDVKLKKKAKANRRKRGGMRLGPVKEKVNYDGYDIDVRDVDFQGEDYSRCYVPDAAQKYSSDGMNMPLTMKR